MELFPLLFVIFIFLWLLQPEPKSKPASPGDNLVKGLEAAAEIFNKSNGDGGGSKAPSVKPASGPVIVTAVLFGFLVTLLLS